MQSIEGINLARIVALKWVGETAMEKSALYIFVGTLIGLVLGYAYGFKAYNRPIRRWEFWLR